MSTLTCAACTTPYANDLDSCPHCGSTDYTDEGHTVTRRLPLFVSVGCAACGRGPWQLRLPVLMPGLVQIPELHCASCGSQVQVPWPPVEEDMPKITVHGGATNARELAESSPDALASQPLAGAEAGQGHPTVEEKAVTGDGSGEALPEVDASAYREDAVPLEAPSTDADAEPVTTAPVDYDGMTLAELRALATERDVPSYGTKAGIAERLREADGS